jgi:hypothetical protein
MAQRPLANRMCLQVAAGGQSAAVLVQCANGFGKHMEELSETQISAILKVRTVGDPTGDINAYWRYSRNTQRTSSLSPVYSLPNCP